MRRRRAAGPVGSVESDDGMEVDGAALLVPGDLGGGDPNQRAHLRPADAGPGGEGVVEVVADGLPQRRGHGVPQDVAGVVIAVGAQRLPDQRFRVRVGPAAAVPAAVLAAPAPDPVALAGSVDRAEGGRGQGDEEPRVRPDRFGDALAADEAGADQVEGVSAVFARAGRAAGGAAVAAADGEPAAGFGGGRVVAQDFAGGGVEGGGVSGEVDRFGAAAGGTDLIEPAVQVRHLAEADEVSFDGGKLAQPRLPVEEGAACGGVGVRVGAGGHGGCLQGQGSPDPGRARGVVARPGVACGQVEGHRRIGVGPPVGVGWVGTVITSFRWCG